MTEREHLDIPEIFANFEKKVAYLLVVHSEYINKDGSDKDDVKKAIENLYSLFYDVVCRASYMEETIKVMHQIEEGK